MSTAGAGALRICKSNSPGIQGCALPCRAINGAAAEAARRAPGASPLGPGFRRVSAPSLPRSGPRPQCAAQRARTLCGVRPCSGLPPPAAGGLRFLRSPASAPPPPGGVPPAAAGRAGRPLPRPRAGPPPRLALGPGLCPLRASCSVALAPAVRGPGLRAGPPLPPARAGPPPGPCGRRSRSAPGGAAGAALRSAPVFSPRPPGALRSGLRWCCARLGASSLPVGLCGFLRRSRPWASPCFPPAPAAPLGLPGSAWPPALGLRPAALVRASRAPLAAPRPRCARRCNDFSPGCQSENCQPGLDISLRGWYIWGAWPDPALFLGARAN